MSIKGLCVDTGGITFADLSCFTGQGGKVTKFSRNTTLTVKTEPGRYEVTYKIDGTWRGNLKGKFNIELPTGKLAVGDACYFFQDDDDSIWMKYLDNRKPRNKMSKLVDTGGDGQFLVTVIIKKVK